MLEIYSSWKKANWIGSDTVSEHAVQHACTHTQGETSHVRTMKFFVRLRMDVEMLFVLSFKGAPLINRVFDSHFAARLAASPRLLLLPRFTDGVSGIIRASTMSS